MFKKKEKEPKKVKEKKEKEPQYYLSATHIQTLNYKVYYMSQTETVGYFLMAFVVGAAVGFLFYGGLAKDSFGDPTRLTYILNISICTIMGLIAGKLYLPIRTAQILEKRQKTLRLQFRDMLESLATSLGAGKNVMDSFSAAHGDMKMQYDENAYIVQELSVILNGIENGVNPENALTDFGARSGNTDIMSFANVFEVCYRKGGNIRDVIRNTYDILNDKMVINEDIETVVTSSKSEQLIMLIMPIGLVALIKMSSPDFAANFATGAGIMATTIGIVMFVVSYFIGKAILNIKL